MQKNIANYEIIVYHNYKTHRQEVKKMQTIHKRIKEMRNKNGLTLKEVAEKIGITEATAQRYESGLVNTIPYERIESLAKLFMVSPTYLMGWEEENTNITHPNQVKHPLLQIYNELNEIGQKNLIDYAKYLADKSEYKKCDLAIKQDIS